MPLLDRFLNQPDAAENLGLLGAYLMAAGSRTTDPGANSRLTAQGLAQYATALKQSRRDEELKKLRQAQVARFDAETAEKEKQSRMQNENIGLLYGPSGAWRNPDTGEVRPPEGMLKGMDPATAQAMIGLEQSGVGKGMAAYLASKQRKPISVSPGSTLVDQNTGQPVYQSPPDQGSQGERMINALVAYKMKKAKGKPTTPEEDEQAAAYDAYMARGGFMATEQGIVQVPGVSVLKPPTGGPSPNAPKVVMPKELTSAERAKIQESVGKLDETFKLLDEAEALSAPTTTGAIGWANRNVMEFIQGTVAPGSKQPSRDLSTVIANLKAANWKDIVGSGQLSPGDYAFLNKTVGDLSVNSTMGDVKKALGLVRRRLEPIRAREAGRLGQPGSEKSTAPTRLRFDAEGNPIQ